MLSIGAMGHGQGAYYTSLGREDYYVAGGEPPGRWHGRGAAQLGLGGRVTAEQLAQLMKGYHPGDGRALIQNAGAKEHQPGWDCTFSAPKSVSVLWSQASDEVRQEIQEAHQRAVSAALDYLQDTAAITRRGKGGHIRESAGLVVARFEHGTSRAQDPQLHEHVLVLNVGTRADGTTGTIESKPTYRAKMTAGAIYRAEFSFQLEARLGLVTERKGPAFEVSGVGREVTREFSKRRTEIEEVLDELGLTSAAAAAKITLTTRQVKEHKPREQLFEEWQERGAELGWGPQEAQALLFQPDRHQPHVELPEALDRAGKRVTEQQSWFTQDQFLRFAAEEAQCRGLPASVVRRGAAEHLETSPEMVPLGMRHDEQVYTTREMLRLEAGLLDKVERSRQQPTPAVSEAILSRVMDAQQTLSEEQRAALQHITTGEGRMQVVAGMAGTGKTTMLKAARQAWELDGFEVRGCALQGKAAQGLDQESGIPSATLHRTLIELETGRLVLNDRSVIILDEAGMVGTRLMGRLVELTEQAGARLVLVGDVRQLQPIEAGGPLLEIQERLGASELTEIRRQRDSWAREAVHQFARGEADQALQAYAERGLLTVTADRKEALTALVEAWKAGGVRSPGEQQIFTGVREEATVLNHLAQAERCKAGVLGQESIPAPGGGVFRQGDRVMFTQNNSLLGVKNGSVGEVLWVHPESNQIGVQLDRGPWLRVPLDEYEHVRLGYAMTTHKGQGITVERSFVLAGGPLTCREIAYVQGSRARETTRIFVDQAEAGEHLTQLVKSMQTSRQKTMAHALLDRQPPAAPDSARHRHRPQPQPQSERDRGPRLER